MHIDPFLIHCTSNGTHPGKTLSNSLQCLRHLLCVHHNHSITKSFKVKFDMMHKSARAPPTVNREQHIPTAPPAQSISMPSMWCLCQDQLPSFHQQNQFLSTIDINLKTSASNSRSPAGQWCWIQDYFSVHCSDLCWLCNGSKKCGNVLTYCTQPWILDVCLSVCVSCFLPLFIVMWVQKFLHDSFSLSTHMVLIWFKQDFRIVGIWTVSWLSKT